ncbi:hypothetical protein AAFF_G00363640 [Aldrovandia affinis]|uniref:Uncharacterized protein n=1 Tax=Aldrovandia affinis TaxID=143900 RepID=A0AAD7SHM0_9TELE|nr:hypothetical protein AAFF_G00363640 [Aldrovandia affinis]
MPSGYLMRRVAEDPPSQSKGSAFPLALPLGNILTAHQEGCSQGTIARLYCKPMLSKDRSAAHGWWRQRSLNTHDVAVALDLSGKLFAALFTPSRSLMFCAPECSRQQNPSTVHI